MTKTAKAKNPADKRGLELLKRLFGPKVVPALRVVSASTPDEIKRAADRARIRALRKKLEIQKRVAWACRRAERKRLAEAITTTQASSQGLIDGLEVKISELSAANAKLEALVQQPKPDADEVRSLERRLAAMREDLLGCAHDLLKADPQAFRRRFSTHFDTASTKLSGSDMKVSSPKPLPGGMSTTRR
ncbi:hypothetical protein DV532_28645 (plasmid) [Pseudomonas sp. Leaf58]|uniref:hypothetical protein n=1 Tax=Pseudomonas sp. Leaf58 TaxID=1736226 RepID=UPI0006F664EC|nr:hypothetical protein [Pseudomonas sp. Leaf58]AYG48237.1 hypothetical protein DV532_28645 [Pseudomonas sp. Leaf58]KQN62216.1 hypothetical protein ASF02_08615 [Pseudomonas sp. Leaf58]